MTTIKTLALDNIRYIEQAVKLLENISDATYADPAPLSLGSSVGAHLRHCLDHYSNFIAGVPSGRIDYDARQRERAIETDRMAAIDRMKSIVAELDGLSGREDQTVSVKMDCGNNQDEGLWWTQSSVRRELQFLISHTVHHFALIKMNLTAGGIIAGPDFGMAPSTLRYHQGASACAH